MTTRALAMEATKPGSSARPAAEIVYRRLPGETERRSLMLEGLMQHDHPLTLQHVLWRLRTMNGDGTVTTLNGTGEPDRISYKDLVERVDRLPPAPGGAGGGAGGA